MTPRVLFVSSHGTRGGSERYLLDLLRTVDRSLVTGIVVLQQGPLVDALTEQGFAPTTIAAGAGPGALARAALRLRSEAKERGAQVIHANGIKAALVASMAGGRVPVVWVKHDLAWDGPLARVIARRCATVVGVSETVLAALPRSRTTVVPPALALPEADVVSGSAALAALTPDGTDRVVVAVGRVHPVKGYMNLIEVAQLVKEHRPSTAFVVAGGTDPNHPEHERRLRDAAAERGVDVAWAGHRSDALDLIAAADAIVVTSGADPSAPRGEGFGYAAAEALALSTPVVGYDIGALREVIGTCGMVVPVGRSDLMAGALLKLLEDESLARRLTVCGLDRAARMYTADRVSEAMLNVYARAVG